MLRSFLERVSWTICCTLGLTAWACSSSPLNSTGAGGQQAQGGEASIAGMTTAGSASGGAPGCPNDIALPTDPSGNVHLCDRGVHRTASVACPAYLPRRTSLPETGFGDECLKDADCNEKPYGMCRAPSDSSSSTGNSCSYGCTLDSECGASQVCSCNGSGGICIRSNCHTDADCGVGKLCLAAQPALCGGGGLFVCETAHDECGVSAPCADADCRFDADHFACFPPC